MKKKGYYEYVPQIYPRRLWVMYNTSKEEIDKCFTDKEGKPLVHNCEPMSSFGGMVYDECMSKAGKLLRQSRCLSKEEGHDYEKCQPRGAPHPVVYL